MTRSKPSSRDFAASWSCSHDGRPPPRYADGPVEVPEWTGDLETDVIAAIRTVFDPEIPVNVYDLGLIYRLDSRTPT